VTTDLSVPDGPNYEDLGINLRSMVSAIFQHHISPAMEDIQAQYDCQLALARQYIERQLNEQLFADSGKEPEVKKIRCSKGC